MNRAVFAIHHSKEVKMRYTIDRFEENFAVVELEDKKFVNVPREVVPPEAKEGDIIFSTVDNAGTKEQRKKIEEIMKTMWIN